jgi:transcription antitermination factor NusG
VPKKKPEASKREFHVGDQVRVKLHTGQTVDATIKAIIEKTDGLRLQVDYEKDQTALIYEWQVAKNQRP